MCIKLYKNIGYCISTFLASRFSVVCYCLLSLSLSPPSLVPSFLSLSPTLLSLSLAYITRCEVHSVYKRLSDKRYVYMILVEWSDGTQYTIRRTYGDFFSFQTKVSVARIHLSSLATMYSTLNKIILL